MQTPVANKFDVTTLLGSQLSLSTLLPVVPLAQHEFTLNNFYNVFPNETPTVAPVLQYFGVGIKGCYNADNNILSSAYRPQRTNMNLYEPIPIRCRPVDEDLSTADRKKYRLRQRKTINGQDYWLYYLKKLDINDTVKFKRIHPITGAEEPYELNSSNLQPTPIRPDSDGVITTDMAQVIAYVEVKVQLEADEVLEYILAKYGDARYARISEIGLFTGVDKQVTGSDNSGSRFQYTESIYTMLFNHLTNLGTDLSDHGSVIDSTFEITSRGAMLSEE